RRTWRCSAWWRGASSPRGSAARPRARPSRRAPSPPRRSFGCTPPPPRPSPRGAGGGGGRAGRSSPPPPPPPPPAAGAAAGLAPRWWALSVLAFAAALLAKSLAVPLPLTLLLLDVYPLRRRGVGWRALLVEKVPYASLAVAAGAVALYTRQESGNITAYGQY